MSGLIFVISGSSGCGKTTISENVQELGEKIITSTTRGARPGEIDGVDYYFLSEDEFNSRDFVESDLKYGNYYGTEVKEVEKKMSSGDIYAILTYNGYLDFKKKYKENVVGIFIHTSKSDIKLMLEKRSEDNIDKRMVDYEADLKNMPEYDYIIKNEMGKMDESIKTLKDIINFERWRKASI